MGRAEQFLSFIKTRQGVIFVSILWGLGLACLFRVVCKDKECIVFKAPPRSEMEGVFHHNGECYLFKEETTVCDGSEVPH